MQEHMREHNLKGYKNSGYDNTGSLNAGDGNSGDYNNGSYNAGHRNYGSYNSGDFNLGNSNSGDWNLGDGGSGVFCTAPHEIYIFDRPSGLTLKDWRASEAYRILSRARSTKWVPRSLMSLQERLENPGYRQTGGYLKTQSLKDACAELWRQLSDDEKEIIRAIPNFNEDIFYKITGVRV
ncbi:MAG: pentapeptide repeat-containing protein [Defluviitaleaceae bacterium]|nr:pentapeptide repeat-containing protein [Defluviitaleaceae bacterium]